MKTKIKGFTLAEIMIVLSIIGVLTAILMPVAMNSAPDSDVMKFKKANNTLGKVIAELVNSNKYYKDGDLGRRPDEAGTLIDGTHSGDYTYFCETFADLLSVKSVNCSGVNSTGHGFEYLNDNSETNNTEKVQLAIDGNCKYVEDNSLIGAEITTTDDIIYFQVNPHITFGMPTNVGIAVVGENSCQDCTYRLFGEKNHHDDNGFETEYKAFCFDIDGINEGEDPFGYGLRADGKILYGTRATEWMQKTINGSDE